MANKDILFYSNYCDFSKEIVTLITKKNLRGSILLVCIDTTKYKIPACIDRVPSMLSADRETLYIEDDLVQYIESKAKSAHPEAESIQTFSWEGGNNYSESFSFVNEDINGNMTNKGYTFLEEYMPSNASNLKDDDDKMRQSKFDISIYDSYISSRNRDEEQIKKALNGNRYDRVM